jgi:hypothetical protein
VAFGLLRLLLSAAGIYGVYIGLQYILKRSDLEVAAIQSIPKSEFYLSVPQTVQMTVINDEGELVMEISGDSVTMSSDQRTVTFTGGKATYFEDGAKSLGMEAAQIIYNTQSEDFNLVGGLKIETKDGMSVQAEEVEWKRFKEGSATRGRPPSFRFPKGVEIASRDGNTVTADYMQADRELTYMEFVGHVNMKVIALTDTEFITERKLTDVEALKLEDFEALNVSAEQVIYDKRKQIMLATSRFYDKAFRIQWLGSIVQPSQYQPQPQQVIFSKKEITIGANHLEAHVGRKWMEVYGDINMVVPPAEPKPDDDPAMKTMKRFETKISAGDLEYFWGRDYIICHTPARVEQGDRLAMADGITYWGDEKMVLLDGHITMVQGSGRWLFDDKLVDIENADQSRMLTAYSELHAERAAMYLNNNDFIASGDVLLRQDNREVATDTLVYQDDIKRLTAKGDVKFKDREGQTFLCNALVYHNETDFMEISGGMAANMRLPAKFANDINRSIAESREEDVPPEISDPPVPEEPNRNPNTRSRIRTPQIASTPPPKADAEPGGGLGLPGQPPPMSDGEGAAAPSAGPQELVLRFGEGDKTGDGDAKAKDVEKPAKPKQKQAKPKEEEG